jgi:putative ABC transport system ATP-binding protein
MKLRNIAINNLRRRKGKMIFLVAGLMTGVAAITALLSITQILEKDISVKMEEYGANILITPETEGLSLSYGGLSLGGVSFDLKEIDQKDVAKIREIENAENISIVSPKVFGVFEHQGRKALVVGIVLDKVVKEFGRGNAKVTSVSGIDLAMEQGDFISVMGESGAGKSTLLSMMGGLLSPTRGRVVIGGIDIYALGRTRLADFRREFMGFIFQSFQLVAYLNVLENVQLPLAVTGHKESEKKMLALNSLERVGLETKAFRLPSQLSGGEQERVAIARAVVNQPPILFADEPTGNLDSRNSKEVMELE